MLFSYTQTKLVSPFGRDVAQRQRGLVPASLAFQICPNTNLFACVALSVICFANASSPKGRAKKPVRTVRLTNQVIFCADLPACVALSVICFANASSPKGRAKKPVRIFSLLRTNQLVSPSGRDVAQRQRGLERFPPTQKTAAAQPAAVSFSFVAYSESRFVMLSKLMPKVDRLCSMADVAGWSTPATPSRIKPRLKPMIKR